MLIITTIVVTIAVDRWYIRTHLIQSVQGSTDSAQKALEASNEGQIADTQPKSEPDGTVQPVVPLQDLVGQWRSRKWGILKAELQNNDDGIVVFKRLNVPDEDKMHGWAEGDWLFKLYVIDGTANGLGVIARVRLEKRPDEVYHDFYFKQIVDNCVTVRKAIDGVPIRANYRDRSLLEIGWAQVKPDRKVFLTKSVYDPNYDEYKTSVIGCKNADDAPAVLTSFEITRD